MKTYVLLYNGFVDFEIALALFLLRDKFEIVTFSIDGAPVTSYNKLRVQPDLAVEGVPAEDVDILIIPGGEPRAYAQAGTLHQLIRDIHWRGHTIAAICGGPEFLAQAGILKGRKITHGHDPEYAAKVFHDAIIVDQDVVRDGPIITARGMAYAEFAMEIATLYGLYKHGEEAKQGLRVLKNII
jgi:putative intracellular protease/amidase